MQHSIALSAAPPLILQPVSGSRGLREFLRLPRAIYRDDPHWVPPLRLERRLALSPSQPVFEHLQWQGWVAYRDGRPVGRISAQIDRLHLQTQDPHTGFFGLVEAIDDAKVFATLLHQAESWLRERGMRRVRGPFGLNINQESGLLVAGFETPPYLMMGHARPYYGPRIQAQGYLPVKDLLAYHLDVPYQVPAPMQLLARLSARVAKLRPFDRTRRAAELETLREIFNDAWSGNWGFVPFTRAEFAAIGKELLPLISDEFIQIAEVQGEPVAFMVVTPNLNEAIADFDGRLLPFNWARLLWRLKVRHPRSVRIALMGVRRRFHHTRLGPALAFAVIDACLPPVLRRGVERAELSWILEDNQGMRSIIESLGGYVSKRYRVYEKDLA